ncbi:MAG: glycosyltransferase [Pseudomonadota bacterium]
MSTEQRRTALLVAFHFPPLQGSSGIQRTLGFARHLPTHGWDPVVIAPKPMAYEQSDDAQLGLVPEGVKVYRSLCLDAARHLSIAGRYPDGIARPDRWVSWVPAALLSALRAVRRHRPSVIWSTYPIATSHIVGHLLAKRAGLPWVADFRDPMVELNSVTGKWAPPDSRIREARLKIEKACDDSAAALVFCTAEALSICRERYREDDDPRYRVISNGYEEAIFAEVEARMPPQTDARAQGPIVMLHSGTIYPTPDRDPTPFFDALKTLKVDGRISSARLKVVLRATGHDGVLAPLLEERGIQDIVELAPPVTYVDALDEMMSVDCLLLFQGYTSNPAIPAKLYEYLRAGKPILGLVAPDGCTAGLLNDLDFGERAEISDRSAIEASLLRTLDGIEAGRMGALPADRLASFSRASLSAELAGVFDQVSARREGAS